MIGYVKKNTIWAAVFFATALLGCSGSDASSAANDPDNNDPVGWSDTSGTVNNVVHQPGDGRDVAAFEDGSYVVVGEDVESSQAFFTWFDAQHQEKFSLTTHGEGSAEAVAVAILPDNSVAVTGQYGGEVTFAGTSGEETLVAAEETFMDFFVARFDVDGALLWVISGGCDDWMTVSGVAATSDGDVTVVGSFTGTTSFGNGALVHSSLQEGEEPSEDVFIARYDIQGAFRWARFGQAVDHPTPDYAYPEINGVTALSDDSVAVVGLVDITLVLSDDVDEVSLYSYAAKDMFIARYSSDGRIDWVTKTGTEMTDFCGGQSISAFPNDDLVVGGNFWGQTAFGENTILTSSNNTSMFVAAYGNNGDFQWVEEIPAYDTQLGRDVRDVTVIDDNRFLLGGFTSGNTVFGQDQTGEVSEMYGEDSVLFVAAYERDGTFGWVRHIETTDGAMIGGMSPYGNDAALITGYFRGITQFSPTAADTNELETFTDETRMFTMMLSI